MQWLQKKSAKPSGVVGFVARVTPLVDEPVYAKCVESRSQPKRQKQQKVNADLRDVVKLVAELGGVGTLKQLIAEAKQAEAKLAPFGGILGAEQAIADLATLETALHDAAK